MVTLEIKEQEEIDNIIRSCQACYAGFIRESKPYVLPMNFGYDGQYLYLHSGPETKNIEALKENPNICITFNTEGELVHQHEEVACSYRMRGSSVVCQGIVSFETDYNEKVKALNIIMKQYSDREFTYSEPAVNNVVIWKIDIESIASRAFGMPHPKAIIRNSGE